MTGQGKTRQGRTNTTSRRERKVKRIITETIIHYTRYYNSYRGRNEEETRKERKTRGLYIYTCTM